MAYYTHAASKCPLQRPNLRRWGRTATRLKMQQCHTCRAIQMRHHIQVAAAVPHHHEVAHSDASLHIALVVRMDKPSIYWLSIVTIVFGRDAMPCKCSTSTAVPSSLAAFSTSSS